MQTRERARRLGAEKFVPSLETQRNLEFPNAVVQTRLFAETRNLRKRAQMTCKRAQTQVCKRAQKGAKERIRVKIANNQV